MHVPVGSLYRGAGVFAPSTCALDRPVEFLERSPLRAVRGQYILVWFRKYILDAYREFGRIGGVKQILSVCKFGVGSQLVYHWECLGLVREQGQVKRIKVVELATAVALQVDDQFVFIGGSC